MTEPPLLAGAVIATTAEPLPREADTAVGAFGTEAGVTAAEGVDSALLPTAFVAWTVNVYAAPSVKPVTVHDVAPDVVQVCPPGNEVTT